ncbi:MAG: class I SAM-dependent methyltransferase [Chloroflexi bacterium]|nr:class I SAM-dependent methyltransferase [Chloroflexota bacterium]
MNRQQEALAKACCADLYQSSLARLILGDTLHPGGLALTNRLAKLMAIPEGGWVVDLASGQGASAMAVSRVFHCNVVGVEFGAEAVAQSRAKSLEFPTAPAASFLRGDAECAPFRPGSFHGVLCECSMSLFHDKAGAVAQAARLLRPGGRFGISDVTVEPGCLPPELDGTLGQLLCLTEALTLEGYADLLEAAGLAIVVQEDASVEILKILDSVETKLGALSAWQGLSGQAAPEPEMVEQAPGLIVQMRDLVAAGKIGYWLLVAEKPG